MKTSDVLTMIREGLPLAPPSFTLPPVTGASHCWKDILHTLHDTSNPPALIVADRLADEALWVEVVGSQRMSVRLTGRRLVSR